MGPGNEVDFILGTREVITLVVYGFGVEREGKGGRREHLQKYCSNLGGKWWLRLKWVTERNGDSKYILEGVIDRNWWITECVAWGEMIHQGERLLTCILSHLQLLDSETGNTNTQSLWSPNPDLPRGRDKQRIPRLSLLNAFPVAHTYPFLLPSGSVPVGVGRNTAGGKSPPSELAITCPWGCKLQKSQQPLLCLANCRVSLHFT